MSEKRWSGHWRIPFFLPAAGWWRLAAAGRWSGLPLGDIFGAVRILVGGLQKERELSEEVKTEGMMGI